jgi:hypothetical protein
MSDGGGPNLNLLYTIDIKSVDAPGEDFEWQRLHHPWGREAKVQQDKTRPPEIVRRLMTFSKTPDRLCSRRDDLRVPGKIAVILAINRTAKDINNSVLIFPSLFSLPTASICRRSDHLAQRATLKQSRQTLSGQPLVLRCSLICLAWI